VKLWPILASIFGPGVAQALVGRRRTALGFAAAFVLALCALAFTIFGIALAGAVWAASIVDTIVYVARTREVQRDRTHEAALVWVALVLAGTGTKVFLAEAFKFPSSSMMPTLDIGDHVYISKVGGYSRGDIVVFVQPCQPRDYGKRIVAIEHDTVEIRCGRLYLNSKPVDEKLLNAADSYQDVAEAGEAFRRSASRYRQTIGAKTFEIFDTIERPQPDPTKDFPLARTPTCESVGDFESEANPKQKDGTVVETKPGAEPCEMQRHYVVPAGHVFVLGDNRSNSNDSRFWGSVPVENIKGRVSGIWFPIGHFGAL
jgi:signal peptidase I